MLPSKVAPSGECHYNFFFITTVWNRLVS